MDNKKTEKKGINKCLKFVFSSTLYRTFLMIIFCLGTISSITYLFRSFNIIMKIIFILTSLIIAISYIMTIIVKTGEKTSDHEVPEDEKVYTGKRYYLKYCYMCEEKVVRLDHHCPTLGIDISKSNHAYFLTMLIFSFYYTSIIALYSLFKLYKFYNYLTLNIVVSWHLFVRIIAYIAVVEGRLSLMFLISLLLILPLFILLFAQINTNIKGITIYQKFKLTIEQKSNLKSSLTNIVKLYKDRETKIDFEKVKIFMVNLVFCILITYICWCVVPRYFDFFRYKTK